MHSAEESHARWLRLRAPCSSRSTTKRSTVVQKRSELWLTRGEVGWQKQVWTYKEVWETAISCAGNLKAASEGEGRVAVCVDEGPLLPLVELGVLLAGMCIVPIDPCEPAGRFCSVVMDSEPTVIVAKDSATRSLIQQHLAEVVDLKLPKACHVVVAQELLQLEPKWTWSEVPGAAISHIFFTSGSTGRPKGCVVSHGALRSYCLAKTATYGVHETSVILVASAHTFDPSLGDFMSTWAAGGVVALGARRDLFQHLGLLLQQSEATHLLCTPSLFATLGKGFS
ncbi:unnamed protein product [Durusdinium trenchii]